MKVLYAIQGTGNGHLSRAREIIPILQKHVDELDILVSGAQHQVDYCHEIKYRYKGLTFHTSKTGKVAYFGSLLKMNFLRFFIEVRDFPADDYDLIITDFEPVSAWSARRKNVTCIELSHQVGVVMSKPRLKSISNLFVFYMMKFMCPTQNKIGFHFKANGEFVFTPVIRREVRELAPEKKGHFTVYLPGYSNEYLLNELSKYNAQWHVFAKEFPTQPNVQNVQFYLIDNASFLESLRTCSGVLCGAGFELPAEALYLGKKLMVIPLKGQFEQYCNARDAEKLGAQYIPELSWKYHNTISHWTKASQQIAVDFQDETEQIILNIIQEHRVYSSETLEFSSSQFIPASSEI
jgi:uncharacterized protein (TIGR00661 family)